MASAPGEAYGRLTTNVSVDVAVVGGGLAGIVTAFMLAQDGARVAVVESGRIGAGVTGYTTAKVTIGHGLIYGELASNAGEDYARAYAEANQWGLSWLTSLPIECDLRRKPMVVFAESQEEREGLQKDFALLRSWGMNVEWTDRLTLPVSTMGGVSYPDQAEIHPRKLLLGLAEELIRAGGQIFEETRMLEIEDGEPCVVRTNRGEVRCSRFVIASHYPVYDPTGLFSRLAPYRDYALAAKVNGPLPVEMSIGAGKEAKAFRTCPSDEGELLIVSGESHKVGQSDAQEAYANLEDYTRMHFDVQEVPFRWSTQDNMTPDRMPYIGPFGSRSEHGYVVTGFNAWGMTTSAYAGMIVRDMVAGRTNPWAEMFSPGRVKGLGGAAEVVKENLNVAKHLIGDKLAGPEDRSPEDLRPGEAAMTRLDGRKVAAYRDLNGELHAVSPNCTHMGCTIRWNNAERSWDCPCHGSRFAPDGVVLQGPAVKDLERIPSSDVSRETA